MARLRLLADDLTGALDSAARFVPLTGPVAIAWQRRRRRGIPGHRQRHPRPACRSGSVPASSVSRRRWSGGDPAFKKIDSLLRGHVALELAACMRWFDHCVLAPAFPFQGRITRNGRQLARDGDVWRDTGVDLAAELRAHGVDRRVCAMPETDADLDAIVAEGRRLSGRVLWCGTGGLAGALAGHGTCAASRSAAAASWR